MSGVARLRTRTGGSLSFDEGAIYPLLHAYEPLLPGEPAGAPGKSERTRKGSRRRYYRLTDRGVVALNASLAEWQTFAAAIGRVLGSDEDVLDLSWSG